MLRSTYQTPGAPPPLPEGWTEHKAPTGHSYYYHAATKKSTYTRPTVEESEVVVEPPLDSIDPYTTSFATPEGQLSNGLRYNSNADTKRSTRDSKADRPKHKKMIPGCPPWILVTTKFRRRFIHNPDLGESYYKFPQDILLAVAELDRREAARKERRAKGEPSDSEPEQKSVEVEDEYEEVEVTDDEGLDPEEGAKSLGTDKAPPSGPVEFDEDDFAFQLAMMEQGHDDGSEDDFEEEPPLDPVDAAALFSDLLSDFRINPYAPWDQVIANIKLVEDPRYTSLPTTKSRREVFDEWSRVRIAELTAQRAVEAKKDPRIDYFALLDEHASPKLYWPEFKRKFKRQQAVKDTKLSDKDREKWYREHVNRLKLPQSTLKSDLKALLKEQPLSKLNRSSRTEALPPSILTDLRYISLRVSERLPLVQAYIELLDNAPQDEDIQEETDATALKARAERSRRENALREREQKVEEEKRRRVRQEKASRELLRQGEADLEQAMKAGRDGVRGHLADDDQDEMEQ